MFNWITEYTSKLSNKWIVFAIGCLQAFIAGVLTATTAYTEDIRATFDMTENQYGLIATIYLTGMNFFLPGILLDKYGPVLVNTVSLILTLFSYGSIWQLAKYQPFAGQEYILYVAFFCGGLAFGGTTCVAASINLSNFKKSAHGKVIGVLGLSQFLGSSIFNQLYTGVFSPNLSDYFLMVTISFGFTCVLMVLFVRRFDEETGYTNIDTDDEGDYVSIDSNESIDSVVNKLKDYRNNINPFKTLEFYILLTIGLIIGSGAYVVLFMISTYTESLGFEQHTAGLITMATTLSAVLMLLIGAFSDFIMDKIPRMYVTLMPIVAQAFMFFMAMFLIDHLEILVILLLTNSFMIVIWDMLIPVELHECFGDKHFGKILSLSSFAMGFVSMAMQYFTTAFYENERRKQDSPDEWCHGKECFVPGLLLMLILYILAIALIIAYLYKRKKSARKV